MSEHADKLRETVRELEAKLAELDSIDEESRQILEEALGEILTKLVNDPEHEPTSDEPLSERISSATEDWEAKHPALTNLLDRLIAGLHQLGI